MNKWIMLTISILTGSIAAAANQSAEALPTIGCTAEYRKFFDDGTVSVEKVALPVVSTNPSALIIEGTLGGYSFTLAGNQLKDDFLVTLAEGPSYTRGATYRGSFGNNDEMALSVVERDRIYRLLCTQN